MNLYRGPKASSAILYTLELAPSCILTASTYSETIIHIIHAEFADALLGRWGLLICLFPWLSSLIGCDAVLGITFDVWSFSKVARASIMCGLCLGSVCRHCNASAAAAWAPFFEYWPPSLVSMILRTRLLSLKKGFAQSTRVSSTEAALSSSSALLPDSNSNKTTPKLYTSLFGVKWPAGIRPGHGQ